MNSIEDNGDHEIKPIYNLSFPVTCADLYIYFSYLIYLSYVHFSKITRNNLMTITNCNGYVVLFVILLS